MKLINTAQRIIHLDQRQTTSFRSASSSFSYFVLTFQLTLPISIRIIAPIIKIILIWIPNCFAKLFQHVRGLVDRFYQALPKVSESRRSIRSIAERNLALIHEGSQAPHNLSTSDQLWSERELQRSRPKLKPTLYPARQRRLYNSVIAPVVTVVRQPTTQ